ncbi:MAG: DUF4199 domain-containing protein [Candidatus Marinimicrobia bacterium]|nr:DUF4199 domain-containing protein [Candidatus Neomarinimicrobiota bacterium]MCF7840252.1 DUF4199 domain-containing protein [Candidatus Neomarinimicrobiota bacterium]MCF7902627.1 DUF4199 domain-containing protein [Candidatus Neomarinimicrobiota bacterium]
MQKYKTELKWGVIFMVTSLVWMLLERLAGLHGAHIDKHATYTNLFAIPAIAIYVLALLDKRKRDLDGKMSYKEGVITGLIITAIVAILSPLAQWLTAVVITPGYFPAIIEYTVSQGEMSRAAAEEYFSLSSYIWIAIIGALGMGVVTSLIVAAFTRKQ